MDYIDYMLINACFFVLSAVDRKEQQKSFRMFFCSFPKLSNE